MGLSRMMRSDAGLRINLDDAAMSLRLSCDGTAVSLRLGGDKAE